MRDLTIPALLQHLQETQDVRGDVRVRSLERVAHTGLRGKMNYPVELATVEQLVHYFRVREAGAHELEVAPLLQQGEARLLEAHVVVVIHGIETDHIVAVPQQPPCDVKSDEPRRAGDQDLHARLTD